MKSFFSYFLPHEQTLWKALLDPQCNYLLVEKRNLQTMQVSFDVLDLLSKHFVLQNLHFAEKWWISAVWVHRQKVVFSLYQTSQVPTGKGVIVYDIAQQAIAWYDTSVHFFGANRKANCLLLRKHLETSHTQPYHLETGKPLTNFLGHSDENLLGYTLASTYPPENPFYKDLQTFVTQKTQQTPHLPISYTETQTHILVGYGIEFEEKFAYFLLITDIAGNIELQEQCSQEPDTCFFVHQRCVVVFHSKAICTYFLKEKTL